MAAFTDKVVIITGASEGIGRALARALAPQRPKLVLAARNADRLASLCNEVAAMGAEALAVPCDLTQEPQCRDLIERAAARFSGVDVLVCNAGQTMWARMEDLADTSVYRRMMEVNYFGAVYCTFYALPHLRRSRGRIVGIASVAGLTGVPTRTGYAASKHAMFGFFDSLRVELLGSGVTVTMIAPDFVLSEVHRRAIGADGAPLGQSPMQEDKIMTAERCAALIVRGMARRQRLLITSRRGRFGRWARLVAPGLVDRLALKAIRERR